MGKVFVVSRGGGGAGPGALRDNPGPGPELTEGVGHLRGRPGPSSYTGTWSQFGQGPKDRGKLGRGWVAAGGMRRFADTNGTPWCGS